MLEFMLIRTWGNVKERIQVGNSKNMYLYIRGGENRIRAIWYPQAKINTFSKNMGNTSFAVNLKVVFL